jgi:predicted transcriptional regulator
MRKIRNHGRFRSWKGRTRGTSWQDWEPPAPFAMLYKERLPDGFIRNKLLSKPIAKDGVIYTALDPGSLSTRGNGFLPTWDSPDHKYARPVKIAPMTVDVAGMFDLSRFKWVEFAQGCIRTTPPTMITLDQIEEYRKKCDNLDLFISRFLYDCDDPYTGPLLSNFYIDLDSEDKPEKAQADAITIVNFFLRHEVPDQEPYLKIRWTGKKGFTIEVAYQLFGAEPHEHLDMIWRKIAEMFVHDYKLKTVDFSVYERRRFWRLTNSRRSDCSLYKIPVTSIELRAKLDEIRSKAMHSQPYQYDLYEHTKRLEPVTGLSDMFQEVRRQVDREILKRKERVEELDRPRVWKRENVPQCVDKMIQVGIREPGRETTAFQIACTMHWLGAPKEEARPLLEEFMTHCEPPLPRNDDRVRRALESAYSRNDQFPACYLPAFRKLCDKKDCLLKNDAEDQPDQSVEDITPELRAEAVRLLDNPAVLYEIGAAMDDRLKVEQANRRLLFLLELAKQSCEITGGSASGKNTLVDAVLSCFPFENWLKLTGLTERSLRYLEEDLRTLYLAERLPHRRDEESTTEMDIKLVISEGRLKILAVMKDHAGKNVSKQIESNLENIIMTTTDVSIAPELENRIWSLATDETREANLEIVEWQLEQAATIPSQRPDFEPKRQVIRALVKIVESEAPKDVVIPYAKLLKEPFTELFENTRIRRDNKKLLSLIEYTARLHYRQRPTFDDEGKQVLVALPEDLWVAWRVGETAITATFSGLSVPLTQTLEACKKVLSENKDLESELLATSIGKTPRTAQKHLEELEERGILTSVAAAGEQAKKNKKGGHPKYIYYLRPRDETVFTLPPDFYTSCEAVTEAFLAGLTKLDSGNRPPKMTDPVTGQVSDTQFPQFDFVNLGAQTLDGYKESTAEASK